MAPASRGTAIGCAPFRGGSGGWLAGWVTRLDAGSCGSSHEHVGGAGGEREWKAVRHWLVLTPQRCHALPACLTTEHHAARMVTLGPPLTDTARSSNRKAVWHLAVEDMDGCYGASVRSVTA